MVCTFTPLQMVLTSFLNIFIFHSQSLSAFPFAKQHLYIQWVRKCQWCLVAKGRKSQALPKFKDSLYKKNLINVQFLCIKCDINVVWLIVNIFMVCMKKVIRNLERIRFILQKVMPYIIGPVVGSLYRGSSFHLFITTRGCQDFPSEIWSVAMGPVFVDADPRIIRLPDFSAQA
jgi:hypothetical protein